jgi:hypothetical protein
LFAWKEGPYSYVLTFELGLRAHIDGFFQRAEHSLQGRRCLSTLVTAVPGTPSYRISGMPPATAVGVVMAFVKLLCTDDTVVQQTYRKLRRGDYEGDIAIYQATLVHVVLQHVVAEGPAFRLALRPERDAFGSCLHGPGDVINAILDIAKSAHDLVVQALGLEPEHVGLRVRRLLKMLWLWQEAQRRCHPCLRGEERDFAMRDHFYRLRLWDLQREPDHVRR